MSTQVRESTPDGDVRPAGRLSVATDRVPLLVCAWAGPVATVLAVLGFVVVGGIIPPQKPSASAPHIATFYTENATQIRIGMVLAMTGFTLFVPFGTAIAIQTRRVEFRPVMTYIQIGCIAIGTLEGLITTFVWGAASFRPDVVDPNITRTLNDLGWFAFLFDVQPFMLWIGAIGIQVLRDRRAEPVFPRWAGYFNVWVALLIFPADLMAFFKNGPFSFAGVFTLYLPAGLFFAWILVMTPLIIKAIKSERDEDVVLAD